ncbi:hypothetical protein D3C81_2075610 [compost metagenome]
MFDLDRRRSGHQARHVPRIHFCDRRFRYAISGGSRYIAFCSVNRFIGNGERLALAYLKCQRSWAH